MKNIIFSVASLVAIASFTMSTNAAIPLQTIVLSGTVEIQDTLTPGTSRTRLSPLNAKRVFAEFSVIGTNYALVCDINGSGFVKLMPKSASSGLPTIEVFSLTGNAAVTNSRLAFSDQNSVISPAAVLTFKVVTTGEFQQLP
jgi:hypothetical protein